MDGITSSKTDMDKEPETQESEIVTSVAPDGGWGWVVCFGCFMMTVMNDGVGFSFGVVFVELLDYYKGTKAETAWIFSLSCCCCFLTGPVVAALVSRFGCRAVAAVGAFCSFSSYLISAYTPNLHFLYFSMGILQGLGDGMNFLATIIIVSEYFEKRRAFATGLTVCGAGVGTFVFSPLTAVLIETYAWRGAVLIQAGIVLNCLACSMLYRPLPPIVKREQNDHLLDDVEKDNEISNLKVSDELKKVEENRNGNAKLQCAIKLDGEAFDTDVNKESGDKDHAETYCQILNDDSCVKPSDIKGSEELVDYLCYNRDGEFSDDVLIGETTEQTCVASDKSIFRVVCISFKESFSLELLKSRQFSFFTLATVIYSIGYYIPFIYLPVKSVDVGIDELKAAWVLSTLGISSTVGRILFGYISDKKWVNRLYLYNISLLLCGVASCLVPLLSSFASLFVYAIVYGIFSGATVPLTYVLVTDIVGKANQTPAFGISNFAAGISTLIGPPLADKICLDLGCVATGLVILDPKCGFNYVFDNGWIDDISGSYNGSFLLAGVTITVTGVMLFAIPYMDKHSHSARHTANITNT